MTTRILYLIPGLGTGGAERSLAELLPHVAEAGITPTVVCFHRRPEGVHQAVEEQGVEVHVIEDGWPARVAGVHRLIRTQRPDLVHSVLFEANLVARAATMATPVPLLTSLVNTPYVPARRAGRAVPGWKHRIVQEVDRRTGRWRTTHFHAITEAVRQAAVRDLSIPPEHITVIERGRDPARLGVPSPARRRAARRALGLTPDDVVLVSAGRQEHQKGQVHLLEAMHRLARVDDRLVLLLAGRPGHATSDLERVGIDLVRAGRVRFLGHRTDLPEVLAAAHLFVFPSLFEGLGGVVIEAMALGLPVIASDIPAMREVLEDGRNADLVPPASPDALADATMALLGDPVRRERYARHSRAVFDERFTLERSARRMMALYGQLLPEVLPSSRIAS